MPPRAYTHRLKSLPLALAVSLAISSTALPLCADIITKADNADNLNLPSSWLGIPPTSTDIALFDNTLTTPNTTILGTNLSWLGIQLSGATVPITINPDGNTLTLGASGITLDASSNGLTLNNLLSLATPQTWSNFSPAPLIINGTISGSAPLTLAGNISLNAANTYTAGTTITSGTITLSNESALGGPTAGPLTFAPTSNAVLQLNGSSTASNDILIGALSGDSTALIQNTHTTSAVNTLVMNSNTATTFSGTIHDGPSAHVGLRLLSGTLNLTGPVTTTGSLSVHSGKMILSGPQVNITASVFRSDPAPAAVTIGEVGNAVLQVDGATLSTAVLTGLPSMQIGSGTSSQAAVIVNAGSLSTNHELWIATRGGGYGALIVNGGIVTTASWLAVARGNDLNAPAGVGSGILNVNGGVVNVNNLPLTIGSVPAGGDKSVLHASLTATAGIINANANMFVAELSSAVVTISGSAVLNVPVASSSTAGAGVSPGAGITITNLAGITGILNLNGGTVTTTRIGGAAGTAILSFNGGTLKAASATPYADTFINGLGKAYVYAGGSSIDDNGQNITIPQSLVAPTGNGISAITAAPGTGYFAPPFVTLTGGGGTGATAIANIDASGNLTSISITNPGVGYTAAPAISLFGGGGTLSSTASTLTLAPNISGGLTKLGPGTLTLSGANTYTGPTVVNSGQLRISSTLNNTHVFVNNNATLYVTASTGAAAPVTINGGGTLAGTGTVAGSITLAAGSTPATQGAVGFLDGLASTLTLIGGLTAGGTAGNSSLLQFDLGLFSGGNDRLSFVNNPLTVNPGGALIHLNNLGAAVPGNSYTLMTFTNATPPSNISLDPASVHLGLSTASLNTTSNAITVSISGPPIPAAAYWTGAYGGAWNAAGGVSSDQANFNTDPGSGINTLQLPGPTTDVYFTANSPANLTTTLGQNFIIKSLTINSGTGPITITDSHSLTIQNGISLQSGAAGLTINAPMPLFTNQTWSNLSNAPLAISGTISATGNTLTTIGSIQLLGSASIKGSPTISIASGTFQAGSGGAGGAIDSTVSFVNNGLLSFNRSDSFTLGNIPTLGSPISGTGSVQQLGLGTITLAGSNSYSGGTTISAGSLIAFTGSWNPLGSGPVLNNAHLSFLLIPSLNSTIPNTLSGSGDVTVGAPGSTGQSTLTFSGTQDYHAATSLTTTNVVLAFSGAATHSIGPIISSGWLQINAGASLTSDGFTTTPLVTSVVALIVNGTHVIRPNGSSSGTSKFNSLTIANTAGIYSGKLDLTNNKLILQSTTPADKSAKIAQLNAAISSGAGVSTSPPTWTGKGLTSSTAAQDPSHYGVGVFDNALLQLTSFGGQPTDTNSILTSIAHLGDANDNGIVDIQDLTIIANHWQTPQNNWAAGDLNRDNIVDIQDFTIVANNWQQSSAFPLNPSGLTSQDSGPTPIPEPASLLLLSLLSPLLLRRQPRQCRFLTSFPDSDC